MKKRSLLLLLLALSLLLCSCGQLPTLQAESGGYRHSKSGKFYVESPWNYLAATRSKEAAATLSDATGERPLYDAGSDFLCDERGELWIPATAKLPSITDFSPNRVMLCKEDTLRVELASSTDSSLVGSLARAFVAQDGVLTRDGWPQGFSETRYLLLFSSETYPALFYRLGDLVLEKGDDPYSEWTYPDDFLVLLYDREIDRYVGIPVALHNLLTGDAS